MSYMKNDDVIQLFKDIEDIKEDENYSDTEIDSKVLIIQNKIVEGLSFLVYSATKKYRKFPNYNDLVQEGFIGLIRAARRFNYNLFPNFFVYADRWIAYCIKRAASRFDIIYSPNKNRVVYSGGEASPIEEFSDDDPEEIFFEKEQTNQIEEVLGEFPDRERDIVRRIFGLGDYSAQSLREIGPFYDLTHERVRQIKNKVISKLRKNGRICEYTNMET